MYDSWYHSRGGEIHRVDGEFPWTIAKRIINNNIGKSFDNAFSYYCTKVPKYQQNIFLKEFEEKRGWRGNHLNDYYIDENGLIQEYDESDPYKGPYEFISIDATFEMRHKETGRKKPEYHWWDKKYKESDYVSVMVTGWCKTFESKRDPEYKRLNKEKYKANKKAWKEKYSRPRLSDEEFRKILRAKELKEKEENLVKIISHGFDPLTSFRKEKQS
jgi:hypothetical protein